MTTADSHVVKNALNEIEKLVTRTVFQVWRESEDTQTSIPMMKQLTLNIASFKATTDDPFYRFMFNAPDVMNSIGLIRNLSSNYLNSSEHDYKKGSMFEPDNLFHSCRSQGRELNSIVDIMTREIARAHEVFEKYNTTPSTTEETRTMFGKNQIESRADKAMSSFEDYLPEITAENIAKGVASDVLESFLKKSEMDGDQYQTHLHNLASSSEENKSRVWKFIAAHVQAVLEGKAVGSMNYYGAMDPSYMELVKASHDYSVAHSRPEQRVIIAMKAEWDDLQHAIYRAYLDDSMVVNFYDFNQLKCAKLVKESKYFQMLNVIGQYSEIHKDDIETAMKVMVDLLKKDMENNE